MDSLQIDEGSCNVLVTSSTLETCTECLDRGDPNRRAELTVSYPNASAEDTGFGDHSRAQPAKKGLISIGDTMRSATAAGSDGPTFTGAVAQDAIADPTNLQRLGTSVSEFCQRWDDADYYIRVCFDSLTELIDHTSPEVVFQFCHVMTTRLDGVDAFAHFHLDPDEHDDETVATFQSIFDATVGEETQADAVDVDYEEATDDDVAAIAESWSEEASYSIVDDSDDRPDGAAAAADEDSYGRPDEVTEATDDDVESMLADRL